MMADKLAIVFDGPPANESGRFVEVELNGASVSFGEWQENGDYWELVLPDPYALLAGLDVKTAQAVANFIDANRVPSPWRDTGTRLRVFANWLRTAASSRKEN